MIENYDEASKVIFFHHPMTLAPDPDPFYLQRNPHTYLTFLNGTIENKKSQKAILGGISA